MHNVSHTYYYLVIQESQLHVCLLGRLAMWGAYLCDIQPPLDIRQSSLGWTSQTHRMTLQSDLHITLSIINITNTRHLTHPRHACVWYPPASGCAVWSEFESPTHTEPHCKQILHKFYLKIFTHLPFHLSEPCMCVTFTGRDLNLPHTRMIPQSNFQLIYIALKHLAHQSHACVWGIHPPLDVRFRYIESSTHTSDSAKQCFHK